MILLEVKLGDSLFDVQFEDDEIKKAYLYVGYSNYFVVDSIDVTEQINDLAKEKFFEKLEIYKSIKPGKY